MNFSDDNDEERINRSYESGRRIYLSLIDHFKPFSQKNFDLSINAMRYAMSALIRNVKDKEDRKELIQIIYKYLNDDAEYFDSLGD